MAGAKASPKRSPSEPVSATPPDPPPSLICCSACEEFPPPLPCRNGCSPSC
jgi:hypothetical protein